MCHVAHGVRCSFSWKFSGSLFLILRLLSVPSLNTFMSMTSGTCEVTLSPLNDTTIETLTLSTAELHGWVSSSSSSSLVFGNRWIHSVRRVSAHMGYQCISHIGVEAFQVAYYCVINRYVWTNVKIIAAFVIAVPYICIILFICLNIDYESKANVDIAYPAAQELHHYGQFGEKFYHHKCNQIV